MVFKLFVYGTLKRGFSNHERFCGEAISIEEAMAFGDLYDLPFGFPALVIPGESIQAVGTTNYTFDTTEQQRLDIPERSSIPDGARTYGEILTFDDPENRLPEIDRLEGFDPNGQSLYRRVLVPVEAATRSTLAWAYAIEKPTGAHLPGGRWPS